MKKNAETGCFLIEEEKDEWYRKIVMGGTVVESSWRVPIRFKESPRCAFIHYWKSRFQFTFFMQKTNKLKGRVKRLSYLFIARQKSQPLFSFKESGRVNL